MKREIILCFIFIIIFSPFLLSAQVKFQQMQSISEVAVKKEIKKTNVKQEEAENEVTKAIYSIGLSTPSIGNDPCQGIGKTIGGMKKYGTKGASEVTGLPTKPSVSVGKQEQAMEGEVNREEENKQIISEMDAAMSDFLNNNNESAQKHLDNARDINDNRTRRDMEEVKNAENPTAEQLDRLAEDIWTGGVIGRNDDSLNFQAWQEFAKGAIRSSEYPEDRKELLKKTIYTPNPEFVPCDSPVCKKADEVRKKFTKQLEADKERKSKITKQEQIGGKGRSDKQPTETYPGESTKSGYEKEKSSKIDKKESIIYPSDSAQGKGRGNIDFCGRNLPTPEEAAAMGFDPGRIINPATGDWKGSIKQRATERTLTWSKTVSTDRNVIIVENTYKDGELIEINYNFFDKKGNKIGYASYKYKTKTVEAKRFK
ncbi:MAG: hypothetical protein N3A00_03165 [Thermodesulfovibrio sp.]|nr:hypothetical protein [Thermodesulfovibrio sp.]